MTTTEIINLLHKSINNKDYDMVPTTKNRNSRRKHGLTLYELEDFLLSINEEDLVRGPIKDRDLPSEELFIFNKEIKHRIKILSCHDINYWEDDEDGE